MTLIVTDLLRKFINAQDTLGGPFDTPGAFFDAMQAFLDSKEARATIETAWLRHAIEESLASGPTLSADEVFAKLKKRSEQMLDVQMREETRGITGDIHALEVIRLHIADVESCSGGLKFETFEGITYMHRVAERAIQVVASAISVLPPEITDTFNPDDAARLETLAGRIPAIGDPLPAEDLWEAITGPLARLDTAVKARLEQHKQA